MRIEQFESWGRVKRVASPSVQIHWLNDPIPLPSDARRLAYGLGRSYGDSCLLSNGTMLRTAGLDRFINFDAESGILRAEAGVTLSEILEWSVPRGWFLPTTPGTRFVTLGGAIANDIHGKNHHKAGTFGCHVPRICLLRSDGSRLECSLANNEPLYRATIGGLGLTGLILWADLQLVRVPSAWLDVELLPFKGVRDFETLSRESAESWEHTVAWIDTVSRNPRGIFIRGKYHDQAPGGKNLRETHRSPGLRVPFLLPDFTLNLWTVRAFNALFFHRVPSRGRRFIQHYEPFFYPLDAVDGWSKIYGKRGFFQYQSVTPESAGIEPVEELLRRISRSGEASFLAVLKTFGRRQSPGLLSFPMPGLTLALDFPNRGEATLRLFNKLDNIVRSAKGRLYPGKDSRMNAKDFQDGYPELGEFVPHVDPAFSSDFWQRVAPRRAG